MGLAYGTAIPLALLFGGATIVPASCVVEDIGALRAMTGVTTGTVIAPRVERDWRGGRFTPVRYRYEVNGREYVGDRRYLGSHGAATSEVQVGGRARRVPESDIPEGTLVTVHFDPRDPAAACLEPGIASLTLGLTLVGLSIAILVALAGAPRRVARWPAPLVAGSALYGGLTAALFNPNLPPATLPGWLGGLAAASVVTAGITAYVLRATGAWEDGPSLDR